jgi:CRP-like cAMP-binding protein
MESVLRQLRSLASLSETEIGLVRRLAESRTRHAAGEILDARRPRMVTSGWACRQRLLADGRRQIFGLVLPGDGFGLDRRSAGSGLFSVVALTALETVDAAPLAEAARDGSSPGLAEALHGLEAMDEALQLDQIVRLGQLTAYERVAHFLLETQHRLEAAGLGDAQRFPLPLTQEMMADALGLSIVHVNRILQQLRREKLIELRSGVAILLQRDALAAVCDYAPLHDANRAA